MKSLILICFLTAFLLQDKIDDNYFYEVFSSDSIEKIESLLEKYEKISNPNSVLNVYKGALYIKKSSYLSSPGDRVDSFIIGKALLENEINNYPDNVEYRFIRLILQEQTPPVLRYKSNIKEDKEMIINSFGSAGIILKQRIVDYSNNSLILDFNEFENK